jgi:hypothetical protein
VDRDDALERGLALLKEDDLLVAGTAHGFQEIHQSSPP